MSWPTAIQYVDDATSEGAAEQVLGELALQDGYLGGRLLPPANQRGKDTWRVQAFFDATGVHHDDQLPDGCRLVVVPPNGRSLGIGDMEAHGKESRSINLD